MASMLGPRRAVARSSRLSPETLSLARVGENGAAVDELQKLLSVPYWFFASFSDQPLPGPLRGNRPSRSSSADNNSDKSLVTFARGYAFRRTIRAGAAGKCEREAGRSTGLTCDPRLEDTVGRATRPCGAVAFAAFPPAS